MSDTALASSEPRSGKELIDATRPYSTEIPWRTDLAVLVTFTLLGATLWLAGSDRFPLALRIAGSLIAGLTVVRGFIIYHDVLHLALYHGPGLRNALGLALFRVYGVLVLTPPVVWKETHNYHHAHTAKIVGSHIGSYPTLTVDMYRRLTPRQQLLYRLARNPLTILFGYVTVFLLGMCLKPFLRNPKKNWDSALALVVHFALLAVLARMIGTTGMFLTGVLPLMVACASGAYLFYAQHNFPEIEIQPRESWSYTRAALESSSFMKLDPVMGWFTGNIAYHHVHHLNSSIPFYRLPEAMAGVPELQHPHTTSLAPKDVMACFKLKLWDPRLGKMVGYDAAAQENAPATA